MPVIGHAFVGMATAMSVRPPAASPRVAALWLPLLVFFSYLPDVANQLVRLCGFPDSRVATHSLLFAFTAAFLLAAVAARPSGITHRRAFGLILFSILLHDALDLLQASYAVPYWPFSERRVVLARSLIPWSVSREAVGFAGLFAVFLLLRWRTALHPAQAITSDAHRAWRRAGHVGLAVILLMAGATHLLRGVRERDLMRAESLLLAARYHDAILAAQAGQRWPSGAKPGRAEYLQAQANEGLGNNMAADALYRESIEADPAYFWSLADYAVFVATIRPNSVVEQRVEIEMLVERLRKDFGDDRNLPRVLEKIDRRSRIESDSPHP